MVGIFEGCKLFVALTTIIVVTLFIFTNFCFCVCLRNLSTCRKINRTIQCNKCKLVVEERCVNDLYEYHAVTQTEEVHCVVSPDFLESHIVDVSPSFILYSKSIFHQYQLN